MAVAGAEPQIAEPGHVPGARDAYAEVEALWRGVRDYESLQLPPTSEAAWRAELLEEPLGHPRCQRVAAEGCPFEVFAVRSPAGCEVFLCPDVLGELQQRALARRTLACWALPPSRSNLWPGPVAAGEAADDVAAGAAESTLRLGLAAFLAGGGGLEADDRSRAGAVVEKLRWVVLGHQYDWATRTYLAEGDQGHPLPPELRALAEAVVAATPLPREAAPRPPFDAAICNLYHAARRPSDRLGGHRDDAEPDAAAPLVTMSLGLPCVFLLGGETRAERPLPLLLRGGSMLVLAGRARHAYHGVPAVLVPPELQLRGRGARRAAAAHRHVASVYRGAGRGKSLLVFPGLPAEGGAVEAEEGGVEAAAADAAASWLLSRARMSFSIRSMGG